MSKDVKHTQKLNCGLSEVLKIIKAKVTSEEQALPIVKKLLAARENHDDMDKVCDACTSYIKKSNRCEIQCPKFPHTQGPKIMKSMNVLRAELGIPEGTNIGILFDWAKEHLR
jgi:hypothetical protein